MFDYSQIVDVNSGITYTAVKGKNYAEVAQRVQAFRKLIPGGYITTDILKIEDGIVYMKAEAGYYAEDGRRVMLATGLAFERQDASNINKTSFIENCETSAIGRALGFIGLGSEKSIASAEEVTHAIETQEAIEKGQIPDPAQVRRQNVTANVSTVPTVPPTESQPPAPPANPVLDYLAAERENIRVARQISKEDNAAIWTAQIAALKGAGLVPNKKLSQYTLPEAESMVQMMYARFKPTGTELMPVDGETA